MSGTTSGKRMKSLGRIVRVPFELDVTKISGIELETKKGAGRGGTLDDVQLGKLNSGVINFLN